jgi:hypothetical protein
MQKAIRQYGEKSLCKKDAEHFLPHRFVTLYPLLLWGVLLLETPTEKEIIYVN